MSINTQRRRSFHHILSCRRQDCPKQQTLHTLIGYKSNKLFAKFQIFLFVTKEKYQQILV